MGLFVALYIDNYDSIIGLSQPVLVRLARSGTAPDPRRIATSARSGPEVERTKELDGGGDGGVGSGTILWVGVRWVSGVPLPGPTLADPTRP